MFNSIDLLMQDPNLILSIEDLLNIESRKLEHLRKIKEMKKSNFLPGKRLSRKEVKNVILPEIKKEVDAFLKVENISMPFIEPYFLFPKKGSNAYLLYPTGILALIESRLFYEMGLSDVLVLGSAIAGAGSLFLASFLHGGFLETNEYDIVNQKIIARRVQRVSLTRTLIHEYTHHVQYQKDLDSKLKGNAYFIEGHARGVTRNLSLKYAEKEHNLEYILRDLNMFVGEVKSTYIWYCKKMNTKPNKHLVKIKCPGFDFNEWFCRYWAKSPSPHAIGNTFFYVLEKEFGNVIYSNILKQQQKI